jgi:hypothetical protein
MDFHIKQLHVAGIEEIAGKFLFEITYPNFQLDDSTFVGNGIRNGGNFSASDCK